MCIYRYHIGPYTVQRPDFHMHKYVLSHPDPPKHYLKIVSPRQTSGGPTDMRDRRHSKRLSWAELKMISLSIRRSLEAIARLNNIHEIYSAQHCH